MRNSMTHLEGPRLVRREEWVDSERLSRICFGGPEIDKDEAEKILATYTLPRHGGLYVLVHQGKPVSQIWIAHDQVKMSDGTIRTGSIGGVCTHPDYRNQGMASYLIEHCTQQMVKEGATLMLISGDAGVYMRLGSVFHGKFMYFSIKPEQSNQRSSTQNDLVIRRATPADILLCSSLYQAEPVHFVRSKSDFSRALNDPLGNKYIHADQWIIERSGQAVAYLFLGIPWGLHNEPGTGIRQVSEYAGSRSALAEAIQLLMSTGNIQELTWPVAWQDVELIQFLEAGGYPRNMTNLDGHTLRIVNFPAFMKDLHPLLRARLDTKLVRGLRFEQSGPLLGGGGGDRYMITRGPDRLELDGAAMTRLVMGDTHIHESIPAPGALAEVISVLFPLPSFLPGLNYH